MLARRTLPILPLLVLLFAAPARAQQPDVDAEYRVLLDAFKAKEYAKALGLVDAFLPAHPEYRYAAAVKYIGGVSAAETGHYDRAEKLLKRLLADHPDYKMATPAKDWLAIVYSRARRLEDCIAQCRANLETDPDDRRADKWRYLIGESLFRLWRFDDAKAELTTFLAECPGSSWAGRAREYLARIDPGWEIGPDGVVAGYDGKYTKDVRFRRVLSRLASLRADAWVRIRERLGVDLSKDANVVFLFEDAGRKSTNGLRGRTRVVAIDGKPVNVITFYTEYVVLSPGEFEKRLVHETTHAGFRVAMGQPYLDLPKWVREGLALYAADQTEDRVAAILSNCVFSGDSPEKLLNGVDAPHHAFDDYLEDALAFEWLAARGADAMPTFCEKLLAGEGTEAALAAATKMSYADAIRAMDAHGRERLEAIVGPAGRSFIALRARLFSEERAHTAGEWIRGEGGKALREWLAANPGHPLAPNARYRLGKTLVRNGAEAEGRKDLEEIVANDFSRTSITDDAAYWAARSCEIEGDEAGARAAYGAFLRDFSWARQVAEVPDSFSPAGPVEPE